MANVREDGAGDNPVILITSRWMSALLNPGFQLGSFGNTFAMAAFFCCAFFLRTASFSMWGCFLGSK
jgi:hypothetical protein